MPASFGAAVAVEATTDMVAEDEEPVEVKPKGRKPARKGTSSSVGA